MLFGQKMFNECDVVKSDNTVIEKNQCNKIPGCFCGQSYYLEIPYKYNRKENFQVNWNYV